jgi:hypothetical protein
MVSILVAMLSMKALLTENPGTCRIYDDIQLVHKLQWGAAVASDVQSKLKAKRAVSWPDTRLKHSADCSGTITLALDYGACGSLTMDFVEHLSSGICVDELRGLNASVVVSNGESSSLATGLFLVSLKPGGIPIASRGGERYDWRSLDSKTHFVLETRTDSEDRKVSIVLYHLNVNPETVDYLPFERGTMLTCEPQVQSEVIVNEPAFETGTRQ